MVLACIRLGALVIFFNELSGLQKSVCNFFRGNLNESVASISANSRIVLAFYAKILSILQVLGGA